MSYLRNFGHSGPETFFGIGINGKNSEFSAAMGLCNLKYVDQILQDRKRVCKLYDEKFDTLAVQKPVINKKGSWNHAYYPIILKSEEQLLKSIELLNGNWIFPRRYFYPSLSKLNYIKSQQTPITDDLSKRALCLPLYYGIQEEDINFIARLMLRVQNN